MDFWKNWVVKLCVWGEGAEKGIGLKKIKATRMFASQLCCIDIDSFSFSSESSSKSQHELSRNPHISLMAEDL